MISYHLNTSLRTKMPMSSSSTTTIRMNSIMDAGLPWLSVGDEKAPGDAGGEVYETTAWGKTGNEPPAAR
jgi:hypothetical protein